VISYGQLDANSPRRLNRVFALEALLAGVTPWPASPETFEIYPVLKPIGQIESCRFLDWRNEAVKLQGTRCASAVYSRPGEAFILLANLQEKSDQVQCSIQPLKLPYPIPSPRSATLLGQTALPVDAAALVKTGVKIQVPGDSAVLLRIR
jgi:hypothetical protein